MLSQNLSPETADLVARLLERCESIMGDAMKKRSANRLQMAPPNSGPVVSGSVVAVDVAPDEDVQWIWSHDLERGSYVSGYTIVPRPDEVRVKRLAQRLEPSVAEKPMSNEQIAIRLAQLERRTEAHGVVLGILRTIADVIKADIERSAA
jgi:hypothetical protein